MKCRAATVVRENNTNVVTGVYGERALEAIQWACGSGLISGRTATTLAPGAEATRAEAAAILMRFCESVK